MKKNKLVALILAALFVLLTLAACAPTATSDPTDAPEATEAPEATDAPDATEAPEQTEGEGKIYRTYLTGETPSLNNHREVDTYIETPYSYCSSSLYRRVPTEGGAGFEYIGDLAAELPIQIDEYTWQIKLREDAVWHNGEPINADTLLYSWQKALDPIMVNQHSNFVVDNAITIVNGLEYYRQGTSNTVAWEDVGFKKIDDYTIELKTVAANTQTDVCNQFTDRATYPVYQPLYDGGMSEDGTQTNWGTTLDTWMGCGPYFFDSWEYDSIHVYKKNPDHWLADLFNFDTVEVRIVPEMNACVELWEQGLLDDLTPDANTLETYIDDPRMVSYSSLAVDHIDVNCKNPNNPISGTLAYRKALYHAINREVIAWDIFGMQEAAGYYVNGQAGILSESGLAYRDSEQGQAVEAMIEEWGPAGYNPEMALDYLNQAYDEVGLSHDTVIDLIYIYSDTDGTWKATGEYLMEEFQTIFEGRINLVLTPYAGMGASDYKATGDDKWDLCPNSWTRTASRVRPYQCFYYYLSTYEDHPNNYFDEEFEAQFAVCDDPALLQDYDQMLTETQKLEEIYLDKVIHIPVYQAVSYTMFSDRIELPVSNYIPGFGWGTMFGDVAE